MASTLWPSKSMEETSKMHFLALMTRPCSRRRVKLVQRCCICSIFFLLATLKSSWKAKQKDSWFLTWPIFLWKVLLELLMPKGILVYSNNPKGVVIWMHGNLVVSLPQVNLAEDFAPNSHIRKVKHVGQGIGVRLCHQVEVTKIATTFVCLLNYRYTHKTSGFKMSGLQNFRFQNV
jgi:hypothetical protein